MYGWTEEQDDFLCSNYKEMDDEQIGLSLNKSKKSVSQRRRKLGLYKNRTEGNLQRNALPKHIRIQILLTAAHLVDKCSGTKSVSCKCDSCTKAREISSIFDYPEKYEELKDQLYKIKRI